jgi:hypothetical protein
VALDAQAATLVYIYVRTSQIAVNQTSFYATVRDVLGGTLKLDAEADVGVKVGAWQEKPGSRVVAFVQASVYIAFYLTTCVKASLEISPRGELLWSIL